MLSVGISQLRETARDWRARLFGGAFLIGVIPPAQFPRRRFSFASSFCPVSEVVLSPCIFLRGLIAPFWRKIGNPLVFGRLSADLFSKLFLFLVFECSFLPFCSGVLLLDLLSVLLFERPFLSVEFSLLCCSLILFGLVGGGGAY